MKKTLIKKITKKNELTVLIPTYNEEYSIGKLINEINFHLKKESTGVPKYLFRNGIEPCS